jgi:hypothetical protein
MNYVLEARQMQVLNGWPRSRASGTSERTDIGQTKAQNHRESSSRPQVRVLSRVDKSFPCLKPLQNQKVGASQLLTELDLNANA